MQSTGIDNPKPREQFMTNIISQIQQWHREHKEVLLCMDANNNVSDPKATIACLFSETDLIDLHYHRYPSQKKPATHQRGSHPINLIAGSPLFEQAMVASWIHSFGNPVMIKGDHRMLGIDFDPDTLFGNTPSPLAPLHLCGVNSCHPQKVDKFCKRVITRCNQLQLAERIKDLKSMPHWDQAQFDKLELIDRQLTTILLNADKHCTPTSPAPWLPELNQAYLRHQFWAISLTAKRAKRDMTEILESLKRRLHQDPVNHKTRNNLISSNLRRAQKDLCKAKHEADALRKQHLEEALNDAHAANQRKQTKALTHLIRAKQNKHCYTAFQQHTKPKSSGGLAYIKITNDNDQPDQLILDPEEMNDTLLSYSHEHFMKAQGSPFTIDPLNRLLNYNGLTPLGNQIL